MATERDRLGRLTAIDTKWVVVIASFCVLFFVKGTAATYGVFITPIEADFGWSRTAVSATFTLYLVATAVASPVTGNLIDRYGPRRTIPVFILLVGLPLAALSALTSLVELYVLYVVLGLSITGLGLGHFSSIVRKWFDTRTMLASGIVISGFSLGRLVFNPLAAEVILTYDWRMAYLAFGLLSLGTVPLAYFLVKRPDTDSSANADDDPIDEATTGNRDERDADPGADPEASAPTDGGDGTDDAEARTQGSGATVSAALRSPSLWLLVVTFFICGFTTVGLMTTHFVPYLISIGFSESIAAQGAGVMGGMTVFGLLGMGAVGDRYGSHKRPLLSSVYLLRGVTLFGLLWVGSVLGIFVFATVYGFLTLCTVPLHAELTADRFGSANLTTLVGIQYTGHQLGGATAALAAGWIFDQLGSYRPAHLLGVGLLLVAPVLVIVDRRPSAATA